MVSYHHRYWVTITFNNPTTLLTFTIFFLILLLQGVDYSTPILLSVIVPCYNCRIDWLYETLQSISKQTISNELEVLIIDDGSKVPLLIDSSLYQNRFAGFSLYRHRRNMGLSSARNTGAVLAKGYYILFLDSDDIIEEGGGIEKMVLLLTRYESVVGNRVEFVYPAVVHFTTNSSLATTTTSSSKSIESVKFSKSQLIVENYIPSFAIMRRDFYLKMGGMCEGGIIKYFEDYDFWLRIVGRGYLGALLDEPIFYYRRHPNGRSQLIRKSKVDWRFELRKNNPLVYGDMIPDPEDLHFDLSKCSRPLPQSGLWKLWMWRKNFKIKNVQKVKPINYLPTRTFQFEAKLLLMVVPWLQLGGADYYDLDIVKTLKLLGVYVCIIIDVTGNNRQDHPLFNKFKEVANELIHLKTLLPPQHGQKEIDQLLDYFVVTRKPKAIYIRNSINGYRMSKRWQSSGIKFIDVQHLANPHDKLGWEYSTVPFATFLNVRLVVSASLGATLEKILKRKGVTNAGGGLVKILRPSLDVSSIMQSQSVKGKSPYRTVIFAGRMQEQKDPLLWVQVAKELARNTDKFTLFLIIGEGYLLDQVLYSLKLETALAGRYLLLPFQDRAKLFEYLYYGLRRDNSGVLRLGGDDGGGSSGQTVLLMTSNNEGTPYLIIEAAALGVPTVISEIGAVKELKGFFGDFIQISPSRKVSDYYQQVLLAFKMMPIPLIPFPPQLTMDYFQANATSIFSSLFTTHSNSEG